jgi:hypothetical protein
MEPNLEPTTQVDPQVWAQLKRYQHAKNAVVIVALLLLAASLVHPNPVLAVVRSAAWAGAGVLLLLQSSCAKRAGLPSAAGGAFIYFLVALLPLLKGR